MGNETKEKKFIIETSGFARGKLTRSIEIYAKTSEEARNIWEKDPSSGDVLDSEFNIDSINSEEIINIDEE